MDSTEPLPSVPIEKLQPHLHPGKHAVGSKKQIQGTGRVRLIYERAVWRYLCQDLVTSSYLSHLLQDEVNSASADQK
ncbi:unnamed protein product [Caretta caretta]